VIAVASDDVPPSADRAVTTLVFVWSPRVLSPVPETWTVVFVGAACALTPATVTPVPDSLVVLVFVWSPASLSPVPDTWTRVLVGAAQPTGPLVWFVWSPALLPPVGLTWTAVLTGTSAGVFVWSPVVFPCPVVST
jgi:hypothetical protein